VLVSKIIPQSNQMVRVSLLGDTVGYGIFKNIDSLGNIIMFCYKECEKPIRYSLDEVVGPLVDYQLEPASKSERSIIDDSLAPYELTWNGRIQSIEPRNKRVLSNRTYYYLNSFFEVSPVLEKGRVRDAARSRNWNYFHSHKVVMEFSRQIEEKLSNAKRPTLKRGDHYYYLNQYFGVKRVVFNLKPRDRGRLQAGNCFLSEEAIAEFRLWLLEARKYFFVQAAIQPEVQKKRGRKPKNAQ